VLVQLGVEVESDMGLHKDGHGADLVDVYFDEVTEETDDAKCFLIDDVAVWIPHSEIYEVDHQEGKFVVSEWLAKKEDLI
jgi:hypothetical protein